MEYQESSLWNVKKRVFEEGYTECYEACVEYQESFYRILRKLLMEYQEGCTKTRVLCRIPRSCKEHQESFHGLPRSSKKAFLEYHDARVGC